jgi:serine O-acetyltransferase
MKIGTQFNYFIQDLIAVSGKYKIRILQIIFSPTIIGIAKYRFERSLYIWLGKYYGILRVPFTPIFYLLHAYSNLDIHYKANIKGGLKILHNSVGVVISGQSIIGENLCLTGGNVIGAKHKGEIIIGDNCYLGANATIIGPLELGNNISIGASACVVKSSLEDNIILIGVPAIPKSKK